MNGGYIYSYWDYKPTYNWGGTTLYGNDVTMEISPGLGQDESPALVPEKITRHCSPRLMAVSWTVLGDTIRLLELPTVVPPQL